MDIDDVMNDNNAWLLDEDDGIMEDNFNELVGVADDEDNRHEIADHTKEDIIEDERDIEEEGAPNQQQKGNYFRKQLQIRK